MEHTHLEVETYATSYSPGGFIADLYIISTLFQTKEVRIGVVLHDRPIPKSFYKVNTVKFLRDLVKQKWNK
jgi:hypothetical protein